MSASFLFILNLFLFPVTQALLIQSSGLMNHSNMLELMSMTTQAIIWQEMVSLIDQ